MSMFCYQCEQSAAPGGCTVQGVCGKTAPVANLQDELTAALVGLARALDVKGQTKEGVDYLMRGLFMCVTNVNFSEDRVQEFIDEVNAYHAKIDSAAQNFDWEQLWKGEEDIVSLRSTLLLGMRGMAAYAWHAARLGFHDPEVDAWFIKGLVEFAKDHSAEEWLNLLMEFGQINLKNGRYASFGQDLLIRKGQISFAGLPSQPMLNIEAIRNPEAMEDNKVTAGVKVIGMASSPQVTIFSDPAKPQDQALSYLLTGRSLENSGEAGSSGSVGAALLGLGLAKSGKVVGGIGEAFGIQDLNLGTAGVGDSSKVQVSGNIGKRLQVKYGVGLFDGLAEVTLRYRLMPQLYFQSVSSTNQVFDLLYQFEF